MKQLNNREKWYVWTLIVLMVVLCAKSLWLDRYAPANEAETLFIEQVEQALDERYQNPVYKYHVLTYRIVGVGEVSETEAKIVNHYDPKVDDEVMLELKGSYKAKVRKYFLGLLPVGQETIRLLKDE